MSGRRRAVPVLPCLLLAAAAATAAPAAGEARRVILPAATGPAAPADTLHALVALPPGAAGCTATLAGGPAGARVAAARLLGVLRGVPVAAVCVTGAGGAAVTLDVAPVAGRTAEDAGRLRDPAFDAAFAGAVADWPAPPGGAEGSYLIVTAPAYADAVAPLAEWRRRQGRAVVVVTTDETGAAPATLREWLRTAYATWAAPPSHVLLVGDTPDIPAWEFSANVTDLPYALLDGDDWLPDVLLGRLPADSPAQAANLVAKTVAYERAPWRGDGGAWLGRSLMVGANYASDTPVTTVTWCGRQLETLGFAPAATVFFPPYFNGVAPITAALEQGVSVVAYRGWAYGVGGWEPPHFTTAEIPAVDNGAMTPVVMSFVCLNGDFAGATPCFGEVFLRQGTPAAPQGAVAFVGNGEHWSHTRFNDAMAIAVFERVTDPAVTDLGGLLAAGKLRFIDYFPLELEFDAWGEESVEFYFHIYNLLGDPALAFWKGVPQEMTVSHAGSLAGGADFLEVVVRDEAGDTPVPQAHVAALQDGALIGRAISDAYGTARLALAPAAAGGGPVALTVTAPGRFPYEAEVAVVPAEPFLAAGVALLDDGATPPAAGNGDGVANPGETIALTVRLANGGPTPAAGVTATLACFGPVAAASGAVGFPTIQAGGSADALAPFVVTVDEEAEDGARVFGVVAVLRPDGSANSELGFTVGAPRLVATAAAVDGDGFADPGEEAQVVVTLANEGSAATAGGTFTLALVPPDAGTVLVGDGAFGPLAPGADGAATPATIRLREDLPVGATVTLRLALVTQEGARQAAARPLTAGRVDWSAPVGPDAHGYTAFDSADTDYPATVPVYAWRELSPAYGGAGTEIVYAIDNQARFLDLPFPFTYCGQTFTRIRVGDNGWISFDTDPALDFYNWPLPSPHGNHSVVAPFWDNFDPTHAETDGIYWAYDAGAGTLTVEWSRMRHYQPEIDDLQTFQVVLRDPAAHPTPTGDGEILFLYRQAINGDYLRTYATVGIEDPAETGGLALSYANVYAPGMAPLSPGLAVLITTRPAVRVPMRLAAFAAAPAAGGLRLAWEPADDRPVTGWLVERLGEGGAVPVGGPLPAQARTCLDPGADPAAPHAWRVTALHPFGGRSTLGPFAYDGPAGVAQPGWALALSPNPAPGEAAVAFAVPRASAARLRVYDAAGRLVRTLHDGPAEAGAGLLRWDGRDGRGRAVADGVYFCRLEAAGRTLTRKLLLVR